MTRLLPIKAGCACLAFSQHYLKSRPLLCGAGKKISFKATAKGVQRVGEIAMRDIWIHGAVFVLLLATLCVGLQKLLSGPTVITTLSISVVWIIYAMVPPFLLLWYTIIGRGSTLRLWSMYAPPCPCKPYTLKDHHCLSGRRECTSCAPGSTLCPLADTCGGDTYSHRDGGLHTSSMC